MAKQKTNGAKRFWRRVRETIGWTRGHVELDPLTEMNHAQRLLAANLRVIFLVFRFETYQRIRLHAQALTLHTLLALVPTLAVGFAVVRGLNFMEGLYERLESFVLANISGSAELHQTVSQYLPRFVTNIQEGELGAVSVVILVVTVLSLLSHIERSINTIFGVQMSRPVGVRLLTYWAVLTLGPSLLMVSIGLGASLQTSSMSEILEGLGPIGALAVRGAPLFITWVGFTLLYLVIPQARVRVRAAVGAALVAGSLWNAARFGFGLYTRHNVTTEDIYGQLSTVPLFILWLYLSWLLVLFGAHLAFAMQNVATYSPDDDRFDKPSAYARELSALRLFLEVARDFWAGRPPASHEQLTARLRIPRRMLEGLLRELHDGGFVRETDDAGLVPAVDIGRVTVASLLTYLRTGVGTQPPLTEDEPLHLLEELLAGRGVTEVGADLTFRTLAERFETGAPAAPPEVHADVH